MGKKKQQQSGDSATEQQPSSIAYFKATKKHPQIPNTSTLKTAKVFWPLSLFMRYHEKEDFEAMVDFAVGPNSAIQPTHQEFVLGDGPQAYNFAIDKFDTDPEGQELRAAADQAGDEWLRENERAVAKIHDQSVKFSRWREILADPNYQEKRREVFDCYYSTSTDFTTQRVKTAMDHTAFMVLDRFKDRGEINDVGRGREMSVKFVLEECALFAHMALKYGFHFIAYPSDCPAAVEVTKEVFVDSDPRGRGKNLLQWLRVGFRHPKPQQRTSNAPEPEPLLQLVHDPSLEELVGDADNLKFPSQGSSSRASASGIARQQPSPGSSSGSSSDEENELPPALQAYQALLIQQINSFTQTLMETGVLDQVSSGKLINSLGKSLISGSPPNEGFRFQPGRPRTPPPKDSDFVPQS